MEEMEADTTAETETSEFKKEHKMRIKTFISTIVLSSLLIGADTFTTADPPMIYIYHFVSYDSTRIIIVTEETSGNEKSAEFKDITRRALSDEPMKIDDNLLILEPLDPKVVSAMVTTAVARYKSMKIAGESIQSRISGENILELVKSYAYPKETDFVLVGEINVLKGISALGALGAQYEIDLKVIDISSQDIISSKYIQINSTELSKLREEINNMVNDVLVDILSPFQSFINVYADSTSVGKVVWNTLTMRPLKTMVGGITITTTDKDLERMNVDSYADFGADIPLFAKEKGSDSSEFMILSSAFDRQSPAMFLQGDYLFRVYLKNYKEAEFYEDVISIDALKNSSFPIRLKPAPPPLIKVQALSPPQPPPFGNINIVNILDGIGFEVNVLLAASYKIKVMDAIDSSTYDFSVEWIGGEEWEVGSTQIITWASKDVSDKVNIELYKNGNYYFTISTSEVNDGSYSWDIPRNLSEATSKQLVAWGRKRDGEIVAEFLGTQNSGSISNLQNSVRIKSVPPGDYQISAYALSEESFPGKHYIKVYSFSDTVTIEKQDEVKEVTLADMSEVQGREVIIYLDPFPQTVDDEYRFYFGDSQSPFTMVKVAGEVHIVGFPIHFSGTIVVEREEFKRAVISVESGQSKLYKFADLTIPVEQQEQEKTKVDVSKLFKFK